MLRVRNLFAVLPLAGLALACGQGGVVAASGGVGGTGVSSGAITGFGSIFQDDFEWNLDGAAIVVDGEPGDESDLALGMVVTVFGDVASSTSGDAISLEFDDDLEGPVASIDVLDAENTLIELTILGRSVVAERGLTVFDDDGNANPGFGFDTVAVDDVVEVSGFEDEFGSIRARRIEWKGTLPGQNGVELHGTIANLGASSFEIGSVSVNFDGNTVLDDLPNGLQEGLFVEVKGTLASASVIDADEIEGEDEELPDADEARLKGFITDFVDLGDFRVDGRPVDASRAELEPNDPGLFGDGVFVDVEGKFVDRGGVLVLSAEKLELEQVALGDDDLRIFAELADPADVDLQAERFTLLEIDVAVDSFTQFEEQCSSLADVMAGDFLEVRGFEDAVGDVVATRVRCEDQADAVRVRGPVDDFDDVALTLVILGVGVATDGSTQYADEDDQPLTAAEFFGLVQIGDVVQAEDDVNDGDSTTFGVADAVEFED